MLAAAEGNTADKKRYGGENYGVHNEDHRRGKYGKQIAYDGNLYRGERIKIVHISFIDKRKVIYYRGGLEEYENT